MAVPTAVPLEQLYPSGKHLVQLGLLHHLLAFIPRGQPPSLCALDPLPSGKSCPSESFSYLTKVCWHHPTLHRQVSHHRFISKVYPSLGGEIRGHLPVEWGLPMDLRVILQGVIVKCVVATMKT